MAGSGGSGGRSPPQPTRGVGGRPSPHLSGTWSKIGIESWVIAEYPTNSSPVYTFTTQHE